MIINILPVLIVVLLMSYLYSASKRKPKYDENGNIILKLPNFYYLLGLALMIGGVGLICYIFLFDNKIEKIYGIIFSLIGIIPGALFFMKGYFFNIIINEFGITENTMFGKQNIIKWNELLDVTFGKMSQELNMKSKNKSIKAHIHLIGFPTLVEKLEEKTSKSIKKLIIYRN